MGMLDAKLQFSNAQTLTASAASTYMYDQLTGDQDTTTFDITSSYVHGQSTYFGEDLGIGKGAGTPRVVVNIGTAVTTGGATTGITFAFQGAPNNVTAAASGLRSDLTFVAYMQTASLALSALTANTRILAFDWPMRATPNAVGLPRFVQLYYTADGGSAGGGTITADVTLGDDDAQATLQQYPNNYTVAA